MKIFISHASANDNYGYAIVELLRGIGIQADQITYTSNVAYGIPVSKNIFNWLKSQINEKPFVIYLLSKEYYKSIACLNEMGAAWIVENEHAVIFTPNFDLSSKEFLSGALDPREIGFLISNEDRLLGFIDTLRDHFDISKNTVLINQSVKSFLTKVNSYVENLPEKTIAVSSTIDNQINKVVLAPHSNINSTDDNLINKVNVVASSDQSSITHTRDKKTKSDIKFSNDILSNKLKDEELLLLHYIITTGRSKLMMGWQEYEELTNIRSWEEIHELNDLLSSNYASILRKFELRSYTEVASITAGGNPKAVKLKTEIESVILDLPKDVSEMISNSIKRNHSVKPKDRNNTNVSNNDDFPF